MRDINFVILKGRVVENAEYEVKRGGKTLVKWRMAVKLSFKLTEYHNVECWKHAEELAPRLLKGVNVLVEGVLRAHPFTTKKSDKRVGIFVGASAVTVLDGGNGPSVADGDEPF